MIDDRTLTGLKVASELVGLVGSLWIAWRFFVPDATKDRAAARWEGWIWRMGEDQRKRRARDRLVFDLRELCDACGCEITREVERFSQYSRQR
jgi:hypothetical protein